MNENKRPLVILTGPTAVGKTALSIGLAKRINGEIISADSMQVYRHMDIGTAKIMPDEMAGVKHYLIDEYEPDEEFNVTIFQKKAKQAMEEIYSGGKIPIVVGGTGFYIQALLYDIDFSSEDNTDGYRKHLHKLAVKNGNEYIYNMLKEIDPEYAAGIHANNLKRAVRALEFYHETGNKLSSHNDAQQKKQSPYNFVYFVLNNDRKILYDRIDERVHKMFENGLVREVEALKALGYTKDMVSMQGIGYKEVFEYLEGGMSLEDVILLVQKDTRHFAKRQLTWFRREKEVAWLNYQDYDNNQAAMLESMTEQLKNRNII
ncbi:MAG: tRNA (adenosine(37)-N6)-dimethylallyltransferase MiaA [Eubacteriales bacterium]|nr:tRNA (adenosine(37)-N6)-dimethylallyltransferase MiaA [Eubacteriales bacterium]